MDVPDVSNGGYHFGPYFWQANATKMVASKTHGNTYAIMATQAPYVATAPTSGGMIVTDDGVVIVEGFLNMMLACQVKAIADEMGGGKPIRYLINTGKHGDHTFGNGVFYNPQIQYVQHEWTKAFLDEHLIEEEIPFMENFGFGSGMGLRTAAQLRSQTDGTGLTEPSLALTQDQYPYTLTLGGVDIVVMNFGFQQTPGDQIVWVPKDKTLFTGNPISGPDPELNILLDGEVEASLASQKRMVAWMKEQDAEWAVGSDFWWVPGHSQPYQNAVAIVQYQVDYLELMIASVKDQIANGADFASACRDTTYWGLGVPEGPNGPYHNAQNQDYAFSTMSHWVNLEHLYSELTGAAYTKCPCDYATLMASKGETCAIA
jgi:glyoxylase-like metal-dependent hydrolase (beta-lactamase superfamily II)